MAKMMENLRRSKCGFRLWLAAAVMAILAFATGCRCQSIYTVGSGHINWGIPSYQSAFQEWADELQFFVNDGLHFSYDYRSHNVMVVETMGELDNCTIINPILAEDHSGDSVVTFNSPGQFYVMSNGVSTTVSSDCASGMRFTLSVHSPADAHNLHNNSSYLGSVRSDKSLPNQSRRVAPYAALFSKNKYVNEASLQASQGIVSINIPWQPHDNPDWARSVLPKEVKVDSLLVFNYSRTQNYSVYRVDEDHFSGCNSSDSLEELPMSDSGAITSLPQPGKYYYIEGNQSLCENGSMKLQVYVPGSQSGKPNINVIVPAVVVSISIAFIVACLIFYRYRKQRNRGRYKDQFLVYSRSYERAYEPFEPNWQASEPKAEKTTTSHNKILLDNLSKDQNGNKPSTLLFTLRELEIATSNFSRSNEVGSGAFGTVYRGITRDGQVVAVKRANTNRAQDVGQFVNEVSILSQLNHRNLVKLLGCCLDVKVPLLVYEFIPNGTLEEHLSLAQQGYSTKLNWPCRFRIAMQTADALKYLHWEAMPPIVHRDVKSANILLADDFGAKVADFGLSKLIDIKTTHVSTAIRGTPGYLDPEYYFNSQLTDKSDVYSFGIVLLELITSKKPIDLSLDAREQNLAIRLVPLIKSNRTMEIVDTQLVKSFSKEDFHTVEAVAKVAVACLAPERASRPTMSEVVEMLQVIRGSSLDPCSFFTATATDITDAAPPIDESLPFSNLSSIFKSNNWREMSSSSDHGAQARDDSLPGSRSNRSYTTPTPTTGYFETDSVLPR